MLHVADEAYSRDLPVCSRSNDFMLHYHILFRAIPVCLLLTSPISTKVNHCDHMRARLLFYGLLLKVNLRYS